jgi:thioredoxin 1
MKTFDDIIKDDKPVLVDFYAAWCAPCKMMTPIIEEVGRELQGDARVLKIDVDKNPAVADQYLVLAVPTFILFKNGRIVWRNVGAIDKASLMTHIRQYVD